MLTPDQKGSIAELAIAQEAIRLGIDVYRPVSDGGRYDLIFDIGTGSFASNASGRVSTMGS